MSGETSNFRFIISISVVATIGGFLFGFDSGVINGTVDGLKTAFNSSSVGTGFNVASMLLGCAVGAFFAGTLADKLGRRTILIVASVLFTVSAWGSGVAEASAEFVFYRVIGGLAVGAASVLAPAYISEVAPAKYRGRLTSIQQIAIITGLFFAFLSNYVIAQWAGSSTETFVWGFEAWRWMFWIELIPATIFFFALLFIPESPRFLVASRKKDKAMAVLTRLMGEQEAATKFDEIDASLASDHHRPRLRDIVDSRHGVRPIVWVGIGLATFQQLVGINVVFYYGAVLWQSAGFSESDALFINVISGAVSIGACVVATLLIDRFYRDGGNTRHDGHSVCQCTGARRRKSRTDWYLRASRIGRGEPLRHLLQYVLGSGHVGHVGRDVPQPDPWLGSGNQRTRTMGFQLRHHHDLPDPVSQYWLGRRLRDLWRLRGDIYRLYCQVRARDQGN